MFPVKSIEAFIFFLLACEIDNGKETALDLFEMAFKFDVPSLKTASVKFIQYNIIQVNAFKLIQSFLRLEPYLVRDVHVPWQKLQEEEEAKTT